jgi:hypothetical protein
MGKLALIIPFLLLSANAYAFEVSDTHIHNSGFWSNSVSVNFRPAFAFSIGGQFDVTEHKVFNSHAYALRMPVGIRTDNTAFNLIPFYYPDNVNDAYAYGGKLSFTSVMTRDEVNDYTTRVFLSAAFSGSKADLVKDGAALEDETFYQAAYEFGLNFDFFDNYGFETSINAFQYMSGITDVDSLNGVMNQQELANLGTLDYILGLPKFSGGAKMVWKSNVSRSDNFISYRYIDFYNEGAKHSLLLSSTVNIFYSNLFLNFSYNHLFGGGNRDLYGAGIMVKF